MAACSANRLYLPQKARQRTIAAVLIMHLQYTQPYRQNQSVHQLTYILSQATHIKIFKLLHPLAACEPTVDVEIEYLPPTRIVRKHLPDTNICYISAVIQISVAGLYVLIPCAKRLKLYS